MLLWFFMKLRKFTKFDMINWTIMWLLLFIKSKKKLWHREMSAKRSLLLDFMLENLLTFEDNHSFGPLRTFENTPEMYIRDPTFPPYSQMPVVIYRSVIHGLGFFICEINTISLVRLKLEIIVLCSRNEYTTEQSFLRTTEQFGKRDWRLSALKQQ